MRMSGAWCAAGLVLLSVPAVLQVLRAGAGLANECEDVVLLLPVMPFSPLFDCCKLLVT
jgi:hypothetical protein